MAYLMTIGFDNSSRLCRDTWYFEYRGVRFKLIQNNCRKWCDVLLTTLPSMSDRAAQDNAYATASEFLCAVSWQNNSRVIMHNLGGSGYPDNRGLRPAKCTFFSFPKIAFPGWTVGYNISVLPHIQTDDQRTALLLFRDALSSNHSYLSFLFFWQILEIACKDPIGWVNKTIKRHPPLLRLMRNEVGRLPLGSQSVGNYLQDDCRNAIAHIKRRAGERRLLLDSAVDLQRIQASTRVVQALAAYHIRNNLGLNSRLHLVRAKGYDFPLYADEMFLRRHVCRMAYQKTPYSAIRKKRLK